MNMREMWEQRACREDLPWEVRVRAADKVGLISNLERGVTGDIFVECDLDESEQIELNDLWLAECRRRQGVTDGPGG